jgi:small subunit ribosomal protein S13
MEKEGSFKYLVRVAQTDLDGNKKVAFALRKVKGINHMFANLVLSLSGINPEKKAGNLNDTEIKRLEEVIYNPAKFGAPEWMMNRRKDMETGETKHILTTDLRFTKENDIKTQRRIKSYVGMRHSFNLPVRGQRTKSNFRRTKGKSGKSALGVVRKKK